MALAKAFPRSGVVGRRRTLRIAILAMTESAGPGSHLVRGFLRIGGASLARRQLRLALAMECQRIICIAKDMSPDLLALQHETEAGGGRFHVVRDPTALSGLVTANDDLLVLAEGLLVSQQDAMPLLEGGHAVLVLPIEGALAAGFERIDINTAWAGAMRIPGRLVERLMELPPDCDIPSALMRIALQAGIPPREVPSVVRNGMRWLMVLSESEVHALENDWIKLNIGERKAYTPGFGVSRFAVVAFGSSLLHAGSGSRIALFACSAVMTLALLVGWLGSVAVAFVFCAVAWMLRHAAQLLRRVEGDLAGGDPLNERGVVLLGMLLDVELVLLAVWSAHPLPWETFAERAFAPAILILLLRLLPRYVRASWTTWFEDRALLAVFLALMAGLGVLDEAVQVCAFVLALTLLFVPDIQSRITQA